MEAPQEIKVWIYSTKSESMTSFMKISISSKRAIAVCGKRGSEFFIISNKCLTTSNLCLRLGPDTRPQFLRVFNKEGYPIIDHYTYVLGGDGCMMEGISSEAFSLAGTLKLDKLIVLYDSNNISIEGSTDITFTEDVQMRMKAFGFNTFTVEDGDNIEEITKVINEAKKCVGKPSFIEVKTKIGRGCPAKEGKASAHGEPLGVDNVIELKKNLGLPEDKDFYVDEEVYNHIASEQER